MNYSVLVVRVGHLAVTIGKGKLQGMVARLFNEIKTSMKKIFLFLFFAALTCSATEFQSREKTNANLKGCSSTKDYVCDRCNGSGHDPVLKCRTCRGKGKVVRTVKCDKCNNGLVVDKYGKTQRCYVCGGTTIIKEEVFCSTCDAWGSPACVKCKGSGRVNQN